MAVVGGIDGSEVADRAAGRDAGHDRRLGPAQGGGAVTVDRHPGRRDGDAGQRSGPRQRLAHHDIPDAEGLGPPFQDGERDGGEPPERDGVAVAPEVGESDVLQGGEDEPAGAQGPGQGMGGAGGDEVGRPVMIRPGARRGACRR